MADDEIRNDGTVICPVHGMRYDPALTDGCIRCPRSANSGKRPAAPARTSKSEAPGSVRPPPSRSAFGAAPFAPPAVPFEPGSLGSSPYAQQQPQQSGPIITILPGPPRRTSRRGLVGVLALIAAGGAGAAAWVLSPEGATDWSQRITTFRYGPNAALVGSLFVPTIAQERACPLLLLLGPPKATARTCTRFARHCEAAGWICASSNAFGEVPSPTDTDATTLFLEAVRANANVDNGRAVVAGYEKAGDAACRLALLLPNVFSGAILECCGIDPWRDVGALARSDVAFFLFNRQEDPSREAMMTMKDEMQRRGLHVTYSELPGGHHWMERDELDPAFAWLATVRG
jgi:hypothetical protein